MLKKFAFVTVLSVLFCVSRSSAQSAVYFCKNTGEYGYCYGATSEMAARECAYKNCLKSGGTQPTVVAYTTKKGFGSICIGTDYADNIVIGCAMGYDTQDEADEEAKRQCEDQGGYKLKVKEQWEDR